MGLVHRLKRFLFWHNRIYTLFVQTSLTVEALSIFLSFLTSAEVAVVADGCRMLSNLPVVQLMHA